MKAFIIAVAGAAIIAAGSGYAAAGQRGGGGRGGGTAVHPPGRQGSPNAGAPRHPQVRAGSETARRIQDRARDLERHAAGGSSLQTMTRDRDRIRQQAEEMDKAHTRWRDGLGDGDRTRLRDQLEQMDQQRDRLRTHLRDLDGALASANVDRARVRDLARDISRDTAAFRTQWVLAAQNKSP